MRQWLLDQSFSSKIVATTKKNGKWGNPDVVGVKVHDWVEQRKVEIVSIECKSSLANWKGEIFEAIAHKRFADRVYFAFALPIDEVEKRYGELVEYAEFYGIGLLVLEMEPEVWERYNKKAPNIAKDLKLLEFREIYHAPQNHYLDQARKAFLDGLRLKTWDDLYRFVANNATVEDEAGQNPNKQPKHETKKREKGAVGLPKAGGRATGWKEGEMKAGATTNKMDGEPHGEGR